MPSAQHLRTQIEATLAEKKPSALSPLQRIPNPVAPTGIEDIDRLLNGGLPVGAISEFVGPECSGRTSLALTFVASLTQAGKVCAWVDVSDTLHPESAAALGVELSRLLWVRCGVLTPVPAVEMTATSANVYGTREKPPMAKPGVQQAGGEHSRMEAKGLSSAVSDLLGSAPTTARCAEALHHPRPQPNRFAEQEPLVRHPGALVTKTASRNRSWSRLEQGLRVTDRLLQAGGFSCIVLDMGSLDAEYALRVPLSTWFRFRGAAERLQSNVLLLTQHACSRNSAGLVLRLAPGRVLDPDSTVFSGLEHLAELNRQRFVQASVVPLRKPPQSTSTSRWQNQAIWAGRR